MHPSTQMHEKVVGFAWGEREGIIASKSEVTGALNEWFFYDYDGQ